MELPKNITQIGETDKSCKIYVEDYVVSYMKQMNRYGEDKDIAVALYGKRSIEQNVSYYFIYGAAKLTYLQKEVRHLSQAQNQEVERLHKKYFPECEFVGYALLNGEMIEGMYLSEASGCRYVKGYACFYEKNDYMLAYMLDNRVEDSVPEENVQDKYEEVKKRQEERKQQYSERENRRNGTRSSVEVEKHMKGMRFAAASMFVLLCMVSIITLQSEGTEGKTGAKIKKLWNELVSGETKENIVEVMSGDVVNTLVAEEQLAAAIREENAKPQVENEQTLDSEIPVLTEIPTDSPTEAPTPEPALELTPAPTSAPTEIPTSEPIVSTQTQVNYESYTIRSGDTLIGLCLNRYGSDKYVDIICQINNISNPDNIQIGQKILLP